MENSRKKQSLSLKSRDFLSGVIKSYLEELGTIFPIDMGGVGRGNYFIKTKVDLILEGNLTATNSVFSQDRILWFRCSK